MKRVSQAGFASWELIVVTLVLAVIGAAGYHVYSTHNKATSSKITVSSTKSTTGAAGTAAITTPAAPTVANTTDLNKASAALDQVDPSGSNASDSSQLNSQSSF